MARRWFYLPNDTAGRIGDIHLIDPGNEIFRDDQPSNSWQPDKKGSQPVEVPMAMGTNIMLELPGLPVDVPAYLLTARGKPFVSSGSLDNRIRKWIVQAGLFSVEKGTAGEEKKKATRSQHGI
jgi:hypothetical protein